jgi:hypothetical protein
MEEFWDLFSVSKGHLTIPGLFNKHRKAYTGNKRQQFQGVTVIMS